MRRTVPDQETLLEVGLLGLGGLLVGGLVLLLLSRAVGAARHGSQRAKGPPSLGSVAPSRHQNISAVSTR